MFKTQCHCGNVEVEGDYTPETVTSCNCSICHRYGALWAYYKPQEVIVRVSQRPLVSYNCNKEMLDFHHCPICGCVTHYTVNDSSDRQSTAINARMADVGVLSEIPVRKFDGAVSWKFID